ncbi:uncharacterized protein LOC125682524 [Ostrea edulis]|uniref:uncharacterized protein LOC125682524 n=1 Tax=Ostrea edulis TaxID=37623 RepID=UPI0024AFBFF1|nr:uncharacterized protein LOC125682524 [Ostrea edulis]
MGRIFFVTIFLVGFLLFEAHTQTVGRFRRLRRRHFPSGLIYRPRGTQTHSLGNLQDLLCQYCMELINTGRMGGTLSDCSQYCSMIRVVPSRPWVFGPRGLGSS